MSDRLLCPECLSGKCRVCVGWTLDDTDERVTCECECGGGTDEFGIAVLMSAIEDARKALESGVGWVEWQMPGVRTTHIAYVHENGEVYDPENGWNPIDFRGAEIEHNARHRLVRAEVLTALVAEHERVLARLAALVKWVDDCGLSSVYGRLEQGERDELAELLALSVIDVLGRRLQSEPQTDTIGDEDDVR